MQPFELSDISTKALIETKRKYTNALYNKELEWEKCDICRDVHELYEDEIDSYTEENEDECEFCPLYKPEWCKCYQEESKLALPYHEEQAQLNKTNADTDLAWERALTEYLQWISIELVRRRTETIADD